MTVVKLGRTTVISQRISPTHPFVRKVRLGPYDVDQNLLDNFPDLDESDRKKVSVTNVRDRSGADYAPKLSIDDCVRDQTSFYFDADAQTLWIHVARLDPPGATTYLYGLAQGFTDSRVIYIDEEEYLPLVTGSPDLRQQQEIQGAGKMAFMTGLITLSNDGARLDNLIPAPVYANSVLVYNLTESDPQRTDYERGELMQLADVFVEDYDLSPQQVELRIQDRRKEQNIEVPRERFDSADYPDIDDRTEGEVIPVLFGQPTMIPAICVNDTVETGNVDFVASTELSSLGTVQTEVDESWVDVASADIENVDLSKGYFEITESAGRDSNGKPYDVRLVSPEGIAITYISDIIVEANERFGDISYTDSNYDKTEWEAEQAALSAGAYYIDDEMEMFELIRDLQNGSNVEWRFEIKPDGRRTIRIDDENRALAAYIPAVLLANRATLKVETDSALLAAEIVVKYNQRWTDDSFSRVVNVDSRQDVIDTYGQAPRKTYPEDSPSLLTSKTDAQERAEYAKTRFTDIRGVVKLDIFCADESRRDLLLLRIYDIIDVEISPAEFIDRDAEEIVGREFYGVKKCKIISINPDPRKAINTVEAVIIGDA